MYVRAFVYVRGGCLFRCGSLFVCVVKGAALLSLCFSVSRFFYYYFSLFERGHVYLHVFTVIHTSICLCVETYTLRYIMY